MIVDENYIEFTGLVSKVILFINEKFGNNPLVKKNQGIIPGRNLDVKNSDVKGYIFHGAGCEFRFKKRKIDIEFKDSKIGFTSWSFYSYTKEYYSEINEGEIVSFLQEKVDKGELNAENDFYSLI